VRLVVTLIAPLAYVYHLASLDRARGVDQCEGRWGEGKDRHTRIIIRYPNPTRSPLSFKDPTL
jgi:hypothetical protein